MDRNKKYRIAELKKETDCRYEFVCLKNPFDAIAIDENGPAGLLRCRGQLPESCEYAVGFGNTYFCKCPMKIFISKEDTQETS